MLYVTLFFGGLQQVGGMIFDIETIKRMEFLILGELKWRMRSITAFSFISFFISFFKFKDLPLQQALKARATDIILRAQNGKSKLSQSINLDILMLKELSPKIYLLFFFISRYQDFAVQAIFNLSFSSSLCLSRAFPFTIPML